MYAEALRAARPAGRWGGVQSTRNIPRTPPRAARERLPRRAATTYLHYSCWTAIFSSSLWRWSGRSTPRNFRPARIRRRPLSAEVVRCSPAALPARAGRGVECSTGQRAQCCRKASAPPRQAWPPYQRRQRGASLRPRPLGSPPQAQRLHQARLRRCGGAVGGRGRQRGGGSQTSNGGPRGGCRRRGAAAAGRSGRGGARIPRCQFAQTKSGDERSTRIIVA